MPDIRNFKVEDWGLIEYMTCHEKQLVYRDRRLADEIPDTLALLEHPAVITMGRRGDRDNSIINPGPVPVVQTERGGDVTYHGPGQLVGYFFYKFKEGEQIPDFVHWMEGLIIEVLADFGISAMRNEKHIGVWIDGGQLGLFKICSVGIAVHHGVTMHGFALNINTDMRDFARIRPCGLNSSVMISMAMLRENPPGFEEVKAALAAKCMKSE